MKTKTILWYIVIAVVLYAIIYYFYQNYQATGNIFKYGIVAENPTTDLVVVDTTGTGTKRVSPFVATGGQVNNGHNHN